MGMRALLAVTWILCACGGGASVGDASSAAAQLCKDLSAKATARASLLDTCDDLAGACQGCDCIVPDRSCPGGWQCSCEPGGGIVASCRRP
jgi:hypothetical protein